MSQKKPGLVSFLQEFSIPLIAGVLVALVWANLDHESYEHIRHFLPFGHLEVFGHEVTVHFLIDDIFMVFFFGIAAKEITEAALPGGSLNPIKKAVNPLLATLGGVFGPAGVFFLGAYLIQGSGGFEGHDPAVVQKGWGIPTATDIALAWLVARTVFGKGHPAINFLLLLAVADDAIGLVIIAIFYGDPSAPAQPIWLLLLVLGMAIAFGLRRARVRSWVPYILLGGPCAWSGLMLAHLHPVLALVPIVPFLPGPSYDTGMFVEKPDLASTLHDFEHNLKIFVDFGLFFFAFSNAGVQFAGIGAMTWLILASLVVGKVVGIFLFGKAAGAIGFSLPTGMGNKELVMAAFVAALGLTVALFVAGAAFGKLDPDLEGQAKMGALFSGFVGLVAIPLGRMLGLGKKPA